MPLLARWEGSYQGSWKDRCGDEAAWCRGSGRPTEVRRERSPRRVGGMRAWKRVVRLNGKDACQGGLERGPLRGVDSPGFPSGSDRAWGFGGIEWSAW